MPEIKFNIGAMVDVASSKELHDGLSGLQGHIERSMHRRRVQPIRRSVRGSGVVVVPFGGDAAVTIIGNDNRNKTPAIGKIWVVRSCFVFDNTNPLSISQSGLIGALCIGDAASPAPIDMAGWNFTALPNSNTFNSTSLVVQPNESLYVVLNTNTGNAGFGFNASVDEWNSEDFQATYA